MASNGGVRTCMASTPVPSPTPGAARDAAPSTENASMPVTSATQNEPYPRRPGTPSQINDGGRSGTDKRCGGDAERATPGSCCQDDGRLRGSHDRNYAAGIRRCSGGNQNQVIRTRGGPAVAFGRRAPTPVRPQSRGLAGTLNFSSFTRRPAAGSRPWRAARVPASHRHPHEAALSTTGLTDGRFTA